MNLNFGGLGDINPTSKKGLRPYGIYLVQLKSVEVKEGKGKQDPDTTWKSLVLHFEGEQGTYQESLFYPNENSAKRYEGKRKDSKGVEFPYVLPSTFEQLKGFMLHIITVVGGDKAKELFVTKAPACKSTDQFMQLFQAVLTKYCMKKDFYLKLSGRKEKKKDEKGVMKETGNVFAKIPDIGAINSDGQFYIRDNFASLEEDKLSFSSYEIKQKEDMEKRKPTAPVPAADSEEAKSIDSTEGKEAQDEDFDAMLAGMQ